MIQYKILPQLLLQFLPMGVKMLANCTHFFRKCANASHPPLIIFAYFFSLWQIEWTVYNRLMVEMWKCTSGLTEKKATRGNFIKHSGLVLRTTFSQVPDRNACQIVWKISKHSLKIICLHMACGMNHLNRFFYSMETSIGIKYNLDQEVVLFSMSFMSRSPSGFREGPVVICKLSLKIIILPFPLLLVLGLIWYSKL